MQVKLIRDNPVSDERTVHPGDWPRRFEPIRKSMLREFFGTVEWGRPLLPFAKSYGITALATADSTLSELVESTAVTA